MRRSAPTLLLVSALVLALCSAACRGGSRAFRPSPDAPVVLISIDTLRADRLPAWGYRAGSTPSIDALVRDALLFENAYAQVPLTLPSHASLLTGLLPADNGVRSNIGYKLDSTNHLTLPQILKASGYSSMGAVSAYVLRRETGLGAAFDSYDDAIDVHETATLGALQRPGSEAVDAALGWIDRQAGHPFFAFVHLFEPHTPYEPPEPFRSRLADLYDGEIATADAQVGRLLEGLRQRGLYEGTLVILLGDHGEGLGDHGEKEHGILLYRESLHVPLLVKLPGNQRGGERVANPVALVDLLPTVLAALGISPRTGLAGVSLLDLGNRPELADRHIFSETMYPRIHLGWSELRSLIDSRYHFISGPDPELFDHRADPAERVNLRDAERRELSRRRSELEAMPLRLETPAPSDPEEAARLAALGYLGAMAPDKAGPRPDPKVHIAVLEKVQQAFALSQAGKLEECVALCREILSDYPDLIDARNQLAGTLERMGRLEEAIEAYEEAIRRSPAFLDVVALELGRIELELGRLDRAELHAQQAYKINPSEAHLLFAGIAGARGDWDKAEREARAGQGDTGKPRVGAMLMLTRVLVERGRLDEALAIAEQARARVAAGQSPPLKRLEATYGDILGRMGRFAEAETAFRHEIEHFPRVPEPYVRLAILFAAQHRFDQIKPVLDRLVESIPTPRAYLLAGKTMEDLGNLEDARGYRAQARQLGAQPLAQSRSVVATAPVRQPERSP